MERLKQHKWINAMDTKGEKMTRYYVFKADQLEIHLRDELDLTSEQVESLLGLAKKINKPIKPRKVKPTHKTIKNVFFKIDEMDYNK